MKKIIVDGQIEEHLFREQGLLERGDVSVLKAASGREILEIHRREKANLIITTLNPPGMSAEMLFAIVRGDGELRQVSLLVVGSGLPGEAERLRSCRANHFFELPVVPSLLFSTIGQLLDIAMRREYRVLVSVEVAGFAKGVPFFARLENISISGLLITTSRILRVGDAIDLSFILSGFGRVDVSAEVVRLQPRGGSEIGYGSRFISLSPVMRAAIEGFVGKRLPRRL